MTADPRALHLLARSRGTAPTSGGSACLVCGASPFGPGSFRPGPNFSDQESLNDPEADGVCEGCSSILGGRPSKTDPPVRMLQVLAVEGEPMQVIRRADFEGILRTPPDRPFVAIWNDSMQKHASLQSRLSSADEIVIGGDSGPVTFRPHEHTGLLDAVKELRGGLSRKSILSGEYAPKRVREFGLRRWGRLEAIVSAHRPSYLLDFLVLTLSAPEVDASHEDDDMPLSPADQTAADIVYAVGRFAQVDVQWGVWHSGFARKRLTQAVTSRSTLLDVVESFGRYLASKPHGLREAVAIVQDLTPEEEADVLEALRKRPGIIVAIANDPERKES